MTVDLHTKDIKPLRQTFAHVAKYIGDDKPASRYLEATLGAQSTSNFHYRPTWDPAHELFDTARTAVKLADWQAHGLWRARASKTRSNPTTNL
jgi:phenol/toluene 2-monooxygenase (NADH) P1/A1